MWVVFIAVGLASGFCIAIPPGPINFAIFEKSIQNHRSTVFKLVLGAVAGDGIYCFVALVYQLSSRTMEMMKLVFSAGGAVFLIAMGFYYLLFKKCAAGGQAEDSPEDSHGGHFLTGLFIALSNPFFILAMIALTELYYSIGILQPKVWVSLLFIAGFMSGAFVWLWGMGRFAASRRRSFADVKNRVHKVCGSAFLAFGIYMLAKFCVLVR